MASITERLQTLNDADLSPLRAKLDGLRADIEAALRLQGAPGQKTALSPSDPAAFLAELERAKKVA